MVAFYDHDGITIYHSDCRDVLPSIDPSTVDLLLTDPPYGVGEKTDRATRKRFGKGAANHPTFHAGNYRARDFAPVHGDDRPFDPTTLLAFPRSVIFGGIYFADKLPSSPTWIVWDKRDGVTSDDNADCEMAWTNLGGPARVFRHLWRGLCRASETGTDHLHPTQKPVALASWILSKWTKPGDLVVDPYMGSGFVAVACYNLGRRFVGVEIAEEYCRATVKRLSQQKLPLGVAL